MSDAHDKPGIDEIGCIEAINALYAYLDGELDDPAEVAKFEHHLSHCRVCYSRTDLETALARYARESAKTRAPGALQDRLKRLIGKL